MQTIRISNTNVNIAEDRAIASLDWKRKLEADAEQWMLDRHQRLFDEQSKRRNFLATSFNKMEERK